MLEPRLVGLMVRARPAARAALKAAAGKDHLQLEPLFRNLATQKAALANGEEWLLARSPPAEATPWDSAHAAAANLDAALGMRGGEVSFVEPDLEQQFPASEELVTAFASRGRKGEADPQDETLPMGPGFAWHLRPDYSELLEARNAAGAAPVRIAHIDTGYDPAHETKPRGLAEEFAWDFVDDTRGARDPGAGGLLKNLGHGTGTLSILAGNQVRDLGDVPLGGVPQAVVVPIRIASSVVLFRTSALARALDYALCPRSDEGRVLPPVDVVSLSMGGLASEAWARAVNAAYEAGICIVAAAGNNFSVLHGGVPTRFVVYPARFHRVIAACGVMANRSPYYGLPFGRMQGNFGPRSKMDTALAAFTPNILWAEMGAPHIVDMNGAGTSAATPQIAAAAALWIEAHRAGLDQMGEPWRKVEAVRRALFSTAEHPAGEDGFEKLGRGIVQAAKALGVAPAADLSRTPADSAALGLFKLLFGIPREGSGRASMFALEAAQLVQRTLGAGEPNVFEELIADPDVPTAPIPAEVRRRFLETLREHPFASQALKKKLDETRAPNRAVVLPAVPPPQAAPREVPAEALHPRPPPPIERSLRAYAFDPSLQLQLETAPICEVTLQVPWESDLQPGPVGEYLEVIDRDPPSGCFYAPVDLDERAILAADGLAPDEGNPRFHQQMVYAVASLVIRQFEMALGRPALWAPKDPDPGENPRSDAHYVPRLRIYPHAFIGQNAYYSPPKKALLFGYFRASTQDPGEHLPGGYVFTCLSRDIVAHETVHALLYGMHRRFGEPTNPDVRAFHEAFADVVALMQHFTLPGIVRHQISQTHGDLRTQMNLLGQIATEFGRARGMHGALRDYIGRVDQQTGEWKPAEAHPDDYARATEEHDRGAVLVAAIFDAFLSIYESRSRDLVRLATGGSGLISRGAIHPDLVNRLADEAAKSARHVLAMCIRALDYLVPVDVTFGEYLRALVTADRDLVRNDRHGYRIAFIDAFRRRGIYPRNVRTLSEESLVWRGPQAGPVRPSPELIGVIGLLRQYAQRYLDALSRSDIFELERDLRRTLHGWLKQHFGQGSAGRRDAEFLGIDAGPGQTFEVHSARFADRVGPDGEHRPEFVIGILQRTKPPLRAFEGGCTLIVDVRRCEIRYVIRKSIQSRTRFSRQQAFQRGNTVSLFDTYFGERGAAWAAREPFALSHRF